MTKGVFVVIDGLDGCGKSAQIQLLKKAFPNAIFTREPGGTVYAEEIRKLLLQSEYTGDAHPQTHAYLFWASRNEHMQKLIIPALDAGKMIFSDRFDSSTYAFQIHGEKRHYLADSFGQHRRNVVCEWQPDLYIILDLSPEESMRRMEKDAQRSSTHFDIKPIEYHHRVREGFREFAKQFPAILIDADRFKEEVYQDIVSLLRERDLIVS